MISVVVCSLYICSELSSSERGEQIEFVIIIGVTLGLAELYYVGIVSTKRANMRIENDFLVNTQTPILLLVFILNLISLIPKEIEYY